MTNYKLLPIELDLSAISIVGATVSHTNSTKSIYNKEKEFVSTPVTAYTMRAEINEHLVNQLPAGLLQIETPEVIIMKIEASPLARPVLAPHVDLNRVCSINTYIETDGEVTQFYDWNADEQSLTEIERFMAKSGQSWLLNLQTPHSVLMHTNKARIMVGFSFVRTPYATVATFFQ